MVRQTDPNEVYERLQKEIDVNRPEESWVNILTQEGRLKRTSGKEKLAKTLAFPFNVSKEIEKSQSLEQISKLRREVDKIEMANAQVEINKEFRSKQSEFLEVMKVAKVRKETEKIERIREEGLEIDKRFIILRGYRSVNKFAEEYNLNTDEAEKRLKAIDVTVENGRIVTTLEERRAIYLS